MKNYALHIPEGVRDYAGDEAALKEYIQSKVKKIFRTNGYNFVETPTFEYLDVFAVGEEHYQQTYLYHLINRQGELMALRSDMTRAIARVVNARKDAVYPQRFSYVASSFRYPQRYQGKLHEFTQAGIELIGNQNMAAEAEVIRIAVQCLKQIGTTEFNLHIGSSCLLNYVLEDLDIDSACQEEVLKAISAKNVVKVKEVLKSAQVETKTVNFILNLIQCSGHINRLTSLKMKMPSERTKDEIEKLEGLYETLEDYGISDCIVFDFSPMSYAQYYTGMTFQIFALGVGEALIEGGSYNTLLKNYGKDLPAVGFGMNINLVMQRLIKQRNLAERQPKRTLVVSTPITRKQSQEVCDALRMRQQIIENSLVDDLDEALDYAKKANFSELLHFKYGDKVDVYNLEGWTKKEKTINQLMTINQL